MLSNMWKDYGCPFCDQPNIEDDLQSKDMAKYLVYRAHTILDYNEYVIFKVRRVVFNISIEWFYQYDRFMDLVNMDVLD